MRICYAGILLNMVMSFMKSFLCAKENLLFHYFLDFSKKLYGGMLDHKCSFTFVFRKQSNSLFLHRKCGNQIYKTEIQGAAEVIPFLLFEFSSFCLNSSLF